MKFQNLSKLSFSSLTVLAVATGVIACAPQMKYPPGYFVPGKQPGLEGSKIQKPPVSVGTFAGVFVNEETVLQVQDDGSIQIIYSSDKDRARGLLMVSVVREKSDSASQASLLTDANCRTASVCSGIQDAEGMRLKNRLELDAYNNVSILDASGKTMSKLIRKDEAHIRMEVERVQTAEASRERLNGRDEIE
ncbi:MAG: hypothetical protein AABZ55_08800 [Bdellovibrionota bacterium]